MEHGVPLLSLAPEIPRYGDAKAGWILCFDLHEGMLRAMCCVRCRTWICQGMRTGDIVVAPALNLARLACRHERRSPLPPVGICMTFVSLQKG